MSPIFLRNVMLVVGITMIFLVTAGILYQVMPKPLRSLDFLIIGAVSTMMSMLLAFFIIVKTTVAKPKLQRRIIRDEDPGKPT